MDLTEKETDKVKELNTWDMEKKMKELNVWNKGEKVQWELLSEVKSITFDGKELDLYYINHQGIHMRITVKCTQFDIR